VTTAPMDAAVEAAAGVLLRGGIVAYPTETVYGLGVDARSERAVEAMVALKGRDGGRGISVLVTGLDMAAPLLAETVPEAARLLVTHLWPGPLTIVLPASAAVHAALVGPSGGVGLRCSSDPWASALVARFGAPLTSTSANPSGAEPARSAVEVHAFFPTGLDHVLDGGERRGSSVSTVVEFSKGRATVLRVGAIATDVLARLIPMIPMVPMKE